MTTNLENNQSEELLVDEPVVTGDDLKKVKTEELTKPGVLSKIKLKIQKITSKNETPPVKVKVPVLVAEIPPVKVNVPMPVVEKVIEPGGEESFIIKQIRGESEFEGKLIVDNLKDMTSYIKTEEDLNNALSNLMVRTLRNIGSSKQLSVLLSDMGVKNFTEEEVSKFYDLLSKGDIDGKGILSRTEGKVFQSLLAKMSDKIKGVLDENGGIDGFIGKKSLEAISVFADSLFKAFPQFKLLEPKEIKFVTKGNSIGDLETADTNTSIDYENPVPVKIEKVREIGKKRIELNTRLEFPKELNIDEMMKVISIFNNQFKGNLDPYVTYEDVGGKQKVGLKSPDGKREIKFDESNKSLGVYGDTGSLFMEDPFKGTVFQGTMDVTRYENRPNGENRTVVINNRKDVEDMETWKGDTFHNFKIKEINLLGGTIVVKGDITLDDAKKVSNGIEKDMNGFGDWYDKFGTLKTKEDFTNWYSEGKDYLKKLGDANTKYGANFNYPDVSMVFDPYKFSNLFQATGIFKDGLSVVQGLTGAIGPIEINTKEMKEIADLISTSEDAKSAVKKIKEENKDKDPEETKKLTDPLEKQDSIATRELADILVSKTTNSKNLDDLLNNTLSQAQFQLDAQKTLAVKESMFNMMKNGESAVLLGEWSGENKNGLALVRLDSVGNEKTGVFAFVEHSQNDIYVTPFKNYYNKASIGVEDVNSTSLGLGINTQIYNGNGLKISAEAIAKYMHIANVNTGNVVLNVPSGELPVGDIAKGLGYNPTEVNPMNVGNAYVGVRLEKQGTNYGVDASLGLTGAVKGTFTTSPDNNSAFNFESSIGVKPLFDAKGFYKPTEDITLKGNVTSDFKNNTFFNTSGEYKINDRFSAGAFVGNDGLNPIKQNNELLKYSGMSPNNNLETGIYGTFRPDNLTSLSTSISNKELSLQAQRDFWIRNTKATGYANVSYDVIRKAPMVGVGAKVTFDSNRLFNRR